MIRMRDILVKGMVVSSHLPSGKIGAAAFCSE
jgi:hypothetical protein